MFNRWQKILWVCLGVAIILGLIWQLYPVPDAETRINALPLYGPDFKGQIVPLSSTEKEFFKGVNVLKRIYTVGKYTLFITVLDGTHNRHVVHDPYYCFEGSGWSIINERPFKIPGGQGNLVNITKDGQVKEALYWFSNESEHYTSPLKYWWQATLRRLTLGWSGPEPVLIMIQPLDDRENIPWEKLKDEFPAVFNI